MNKYKMNMEKTENKINAVVVFHCKDEKNGVEWFDTEIHKIPYIKNYFILERNKPLLATRFKLTEGGEYIYNFNGADAPRVKHLLEAEAGEFFYGLYKGFDAGVFQNQFTIETCLFKLVEKRQVSMDVITSYVYNVRITVDENGTPTLQYEERII